VRFRLLSYNIKRGGLGREDALAEVVSACEPDLVVLQEATSPLAVERIAKAAGLEWGSRPGLSVAFLSRRKVLEYRWKKPRWARHAFLEMVLNRGDPSIFGVHLSAVHSNWTERRRLIELRGLLAHVQTGGSEFHLVTGDFNTLAAGERLDLQRLPPRLRVITWMTGRRIRWQTIHLLLASGYTDAFRSLHHDAPGHTFPTWDPHLRLDYAFLPMPYADKLLDCQVVTNAAALSASDHFPLLTELDI
jgi:exodeoxyribonuclease-3